MDVGIVKLDDIVTNNITKVYFVFIRKILNPWCMKYLMVEVIEFTWRGIKNCRMYKMWNEDLSFTRKYFLRLISICYQEVYVTISNGIESFIGCTMIEYAEALFKVKIWFRFLVFNISSCFLCTTKIRWLNHLCRIYFDVFFSDQQKEIVWILQEANVVGR